jgi:hypothetical protein
LFLPKIVYTLRRTAFLSHYGDLLKGYGMNWELIGCGETEWIQDDSGHYVWINRRISNEVRLDLMTVADEPVVSFIGKADNVRKRAMQWCTAHNIRLSMEHAAYIGYELCKAELDENYVQG